MILPIILQGCGTVNYMNKKYAGYQVVDKKMKSETKKVPIRVTACVTPKGYVLCERRYGATNKCSISCKTPPNKWVERPKGYGGYENKTYKNHYFLVKSPDGGVEEIFVSSTQYKEFSVGQIIGTPK